MPPLPSASPGKNLRLPNPPRRPRQTPAINSIPSAAASRPKSRPLVYAVGVAAIVASGAIIGAILKTDQEKGHAEVEAKPESAVPEKIDYRRSIEALETRRGHLIGQRIQLEKKIANLRESQESAKEQKLKDDAAAMEERGKSVKQVEASR